MSGRLTSRRVLGVGAALAAALVLAAGLRALPAAPALAASSPATYLSHAANRDGGLGAAPGQRSDPLYSGWAALALAAAGDDLATAHAPLLAYVAAHAGAGGTGGIERTILVAAAAGRSPRAFGGRDLVAALTRRIRRDGSVDGQVNLTAFGVMALRAAGGGRASAARAARGLAWLAREADADGGYGFSRRGAGSDADDTGAVLEAIARLPGGALARARRGAVGWLRRHQNADGGFGAQPGASSNAQSTAWAVQGLIAAGVDPGSVRRRAGGPGPLAYLRSLRRPDGSIAYARGVAASPVWVTAEALMALARRPLPLVPEPKGK